MVNTAEFIRIHRGDDIRQLALQGKKFPDVDMPFALDQIAGWQIARTKLPSWVAEDDIIYPPHISMEQCSSEQTAHYKAEIAERIVKHGSFADLTGGFGVDFSFMAKSFDQATYVERQDHLCEIARHNFAHLHLDNATVINSDGIEYLQDMQPVDLLYLDPARRSESGQRTYALEDCTPNVLELRDLLLKKATKVMIKLSPMLDWHKVADDVQTVEEVHIVSVKNECKELLVVLSQEKTSTRIICVNDDNTTEFTLNEVSEEHYAGNFSDYRYVWEPNASIMKAGCFGTLCQRFGVAKAAPHSNLFLSDETVPFPGRGFEIITISSMNKREIKSTLSGISQANIAVRNFPLSAVELRKRLKLKDGGVHYIFGTTDQQGSHVLLICKKMENVK